MSKRENEDNGPSTSKQQKTIDEKKPEIAFDQNPSPDIFKLHALVCFELFDYLSLKDLHSIGQTCKRLNRIAGNFFHDNYSTVEIFFKNGDPYSYSTILFTVSIRGFSQYVEHLTISKKEREQLKYIGATCKLLKTIRLFPSIDAIEIECIKETLAKIENITLYGGTPKDSIENILKYCSNIKHIDIIGDLVNTPWMRQKFPTLESVEYFMGNVTRETKEDWKVFFEQNPNIRSFKCDSNFLLDMEDWLLTTNVTLDHLSIQYRSPDDRRVNVDRLYSLVNRLYERGFYKKLHLRFFCLYVNDIRRMCQLPAVEGLVSSLNIIRGVDLPVMADVKDLRYSGNENENVHSEFICKFPNVERIIVHGINVNQLLLIVGRLKTFKELRSERFDNEFEALNLWALNKERAKLAGAGKVTIYLREKIFLATKWANNGRDFEFIEIKRWESWPHTF